MAQRRWSISSSFMFMNLSWCLGKGVHALDMDGMCAIIREVAGFRISAKRNAQ